MRDYFGYYISSKVKNFGTVPTDRPKPALSKVDRTIVTYILYQFFAKSQIFPCITAVALYPTEMAISPAFAPAS